MDFLDLQHSLSSLQTKALLDVQERQNAKRATDFAGAPIVGAKLWVRMPMFKLFQVSTEQEHRPAGYLDQVCHQREVELLDREVAFDVSGYIRAVTRV